MSIVDLPSVILATSATNLATSLSNANTILFPKFSAAINKVKAGTANALIFCYGDSTTASTGSTTGIGGSYPGILSKMLNTSGVVANYDGWMGTSATGGFRDALDTRIVMGSGWSRGLDNTLGGFFYSCSSATSSLTFTPTNNCDTLVVWYLKQSGAGTFSWAVNGGSTSNISTVNATQVLASSTLTAPLGQNTFAFNYVSGGTVAIIGMYAYNSAVKSVNIVNCGLYGATTTNWNLAGVYKPLGCITTMAPDLGIIDLGINDWNALGSISTMITNYQAVITAQLAGGGDCLIMTPNRTGTAVTEAQQQPYVDALVGLGATNNVTVADIWRSMISYASANANGLMSDQLHPNSAGYAKLAQGVFNIMGSL